MAPDDNLGPVAKSCRLETAAALEGGAKRQCRRQRSRVVDAAMLTASSLDLAVDDEIVLHDSNTLTLRLLPCDAARVGRTRSASGFTVRIGNSLSGLSDSGARWLLLILEWSHVSTNVTASGHFMGLLRTCDPREVSPGDYANALERLHAGMRELDVPTPHFTDRVERAQQLVASRYHTPALADADRELLGDTLRT